MTGRGVECPMCSLYHQIDLPDVTLFPPNYALLDIFAKTENNFQSATGTNTIQSDAMCEVCMVAPATMVCVDCKPSSQIKFCKTCEYQEHNRGFYPVETHKRYLKDQVPQRSVIGTIKLCCSRHKGNEAIYFSESLNEFACVEICTKEPEWYIRSTQFEKISDAVKRLREKAQMLSNKSKSNVVALREAKETIVHEISCLEPTVMQVKKDVLETFTELLDTIQQRRQTLLTLVTEEVCKYWIIEI